MTGGAGENGAGGAGTGGSDSGGGADERWAASRRRLKGFGIHLALYFGTMAVLVPVNFQLSPENPWFVLPMVGWGSVLALHAAYAMGLFQALFGKPR